MTETLLLTGGRVLDPGMNLDQPMQILIKNGRVADLQDQIAAPADAEILDVSGKLITPGFIDFHAHVAKDLVSLAVDPDQAGVETGVTTVCDAGSVGWVNFAPYEKFIALKALTRVVSFLHLAPFGEALMPEIGFDAVDERAMLRVLLQHREAIRGIKLRLVEGVLSNQAVDILGLGFRMARESGLPVIVHIGFSPNTSYSPASIKSATTRLLGLLEAGDVITHAFTDKPGAIFTEEGEPVPGLEKALQRGVKLDAAPGRGHLNFNLARAALARGYRPSALGTDIVYMDDEQPHFFNVAAVMSKFMALGMTLEEVVAAVTINPARITGLQEETGSLAAGKCADLTISDLHTGQFMFHDGRAMNTIHGRAFISPQLCIRHGLVIPVRDSYREHIPTPEKFQAYMQSELAKIQRRQASQEKGDS